MRIFLSEIIGLFVFSILLLNPVLSQNIQITFEVNMNLWIDQGKFNPQQESVDIAGNFNNWGSPPKPLQDSDGDGIYNVSISGFSAAQTIFFKFRINGQWNGREEFPHGGPDREYTVQPGNQTITYWYNDEVPEGADPVASFRLAVTNLNSESFVQFQNTSLGDFDQAEWKFEGGEPSQSTSTNPFVFYKNPGTYDVTLIVGNGSVADTLHRPDYLTIRSRDYSQLDWWNDAVFYEIFVRSFKDSDRNGVGDFKGLTEKLDYLNDGDPETSDDLGITGIWLMPIHPSPSYHGYDVMDYRAVNPDHGTMNDFREFLEEAHNRGIRVIIDFVMNHSSSQHPWFLNSSSGTGSAMRNWYRWRTSNPGGQGWHQANTGFYYGFFWSGMPDLNYASEDLKDEMFDIADYWLNEIGVDGFRLDAVKFIFEDGDQIENTEETYAFWKEYQQHIKSVAPEAFSVGEAWSSTDIVLNYVEEGSLDFCFEFDLAGSIIQGVNAENSQSILQTLQEIVNTYPHFQFGTFLSNHDQNRIFDVLGKSGEKAKVAASIYLTVPGIPFLYYGEEVGMSGEKPDEFIRRPMQWSAETGAGFTDGVPWNAINSNYQDYNVEVQAGMTGSIFNHYRTLIHLRNDHEALRTGHFRPITPVDSRILSFERYIGNDSYLVIINLGHNRIENVELNMKYTSLTPGLFESVELTGNQSITLEVDENMTLKGISLDPYETNIFKTTNTVSHVNEERIREYVISLFPNPAGEYIQVAFEIVETDSLPFKIFNSNGQIVDAGVFQPGERLSVKELVNGVYFFELVIEQQPVRLKFLVKN